MILRKALRVQPGEILAFTGAGGKSTAIFQLARQLKAKTGGAVVTTTTHLSVEQADSGDHRVVITGPGKLSHELEGRDGVIVVTAGQDENGRAAGPNAETLQRLAEFTRERKLPLLIEADGSRMRPLKAPAAHEPVIPEFVDAVVVVAGLSGIGKPADAEWVHRPERFHELAGLAEGEPVNVAALAAVLRSKEGGLKGIPAAARTIVLLNQADTSELQAAGGRMAEMLLGAYDALLVASLAEEAVFAVHERAAGIVLAAGGSTRMGRSKQLLDWGGKPLVAHVAGLALAAGCHPVVVVTGAEEEAVAAAVAGLPVVVVPNPAWAAGQSTSVRAGLAAADRAGSALFLLVDQPFVEPTMLRKLIETHAATLPPIVAPLIGDQRGNPVLFDRATFPDFEALTGDAGGRQLFARHAVEWLQWHDERALRDLDTFDEYQGALP